ncbi:sensor histidine kinase [Paenibacillus sp. MMO-58]|uniref:sensor histidine kinase n=1 Tax=Paenibacillus sp. MMO-58 TaxID=3081290 RepID=UPI003016607A
MSIRLKLLLSYLVMLVVPLLTILLTSGLLVVVFQGDLHKIKLIYETKIEGFEEKDYHRLIKHSIEQNPELLTDSNYLHDLSDQLSSIDTYLYILEGSRKVYLSEGIRLKTGLLAALPKSSHAEARFVSPAKPYGNNEFYHYVRYDLQNKGSHFRLYLITKVDPIVYYSKKYAPYLLISALFVLIVTNVLLTLYMSRHIIKPIMSLRRSAVLFTQGNLNRPVNVKGKDEIGQLGKAFEDLRTRLIHSIEVQAQYETNRKELIANISHDLKTPITSIRGYVDGLLEGVAVSLEKTDKYLRTISVKAAEMDRLIDELFLYSKLDMDRMAFSFETVNISAFLNDWAEDLAFDLDKAGVLLYSDFQLADMAVMNVDRDSFRRVLSNIIQNSLKFMDKTDKEIRLIAYTGNDSLLLMVEDNGKGIPKEALPFVFERFYRADLSRNAEIKGSGLGLAIAERIILEHHGTIRAESTEGAGTRIIITIPLLR